MSLKNQTFHSSSSSSDDDENQNIVIAAKNADQLVRNNDNIKDNNNDEDDEENAELRRRHALFSRHHHHHHLHLQNYPHQHAISALQGDALSIGHLQGEATSAEFQQSYRAGSTGSDTRDDDIFGESGGFGEFCLFYAVTKPLSLSAFHFIL